MATLLGQATLPSGSQDSTVIGAPAAVQFTALLTGTVDTLRWYINGYGGGGPATVSLGIYADAGDTIGALLGQASAAAPGVGALPAFAVVTGVSIAVTAGTKYWIAICPVGGSGNMGWLDTVASGGGNMALEAVGGRTSLPASTTWGYGTRGPFAASGTGTAGSTTLSVAASDSTAVTDSDAITVQVEVQVSDIQYFYSGSGSITHPELSIGGSISANQVTGGAQNNVRQDAAAGGADSYSCIYVKNANAFSTWQSVIVWVDGTPAQGTLSIGVDSASAGQTAVSSSSNNLSAPSPAVSFSTPTTKGAGLALGTIPPGSYKAIWLKRHIPAGGTVGSDAVSIRCEGDA